jgi:hypothetical protein
MGSRYDDTGPIYTRLGGRMRLIGNMHMTDGSHRTDFMTSQGCLVTTIDDGKDQDITLSCPGEWNIGIIDYSAPTVKKQSNGGKNWPGV